MTHPINDVLPDAARPFKSAMRQFIEVRSVLVLETASEINGLDLPATPTVSLAGRLFECDESDTSSPHDGARVLVSQDGRRFKLAGVAMDAAGIAYVQRDNPIFDLKKTAGYSASLRGRVGALARWDIEIGDSVAEAGANAGSRFVISRFSDAGAYLGSPFIIDRATGNLTFGAGGGRGTFLEGIVSTKSVALSAGFNLDSLIDSGDYDCDSPSNGPYASMGTYVHLRVQRASIGTDWIVQTLTLFGYNSPLPTAWMRLRVGGVWKSWAPVGGYATPSHFGAIGGVTPGAATTNDTAAIQKWIECGFPLALDQFYRIESAVSYTITGRNGFTLIGIGGAARCGFVLGTTSAAISITGSDHDNPTGPLAGTFTLRDFQIHINTDTTAIPLTLAAADGDNGSSMPGIDMQNVHFIASSTTTGASVATLRLRNIRYGSLRNVSGTGKYNAYTGKFIDFVTGAGSAPVQVVFENCRCQGFATFFYAAAAEGASANDDWQGLTFSCCEAVAVDKFIYCETGSEKFSEWVVVDKCHCYFREVAVYLPGIRKPVITGCYFLGHGSLTTIQGIATDITGGSSQFAKIVGNTIDFSGLSNTNRKGIVISDGSGSVARGVTDLNEVINATGASNADAYILAGTTYNGAGNKKY